MATKFTAGWRDHLIYYLNGKRVVVKHPDPRKSLLEHLRDDKHLTGTKLGCGEGGCGACTVTLTRMELVDGENVVAHRNINACMAPLCSVDGCHVTTVEGIGTHTAPHPAQERIAKLHGSQCGFCTPGFVMSLYTALQQSPEPLTTAQAEDVFGGNLCRCTGYRPLLDAAKTFTTGSKTSRVSAYKVKRDSRNRQVIETNTTTKLENPLPHEADFSTQVPIYNPPAFPMELERVRRDPLYFPGDGVVEWYRPATLDQLLELKKFFGHESKIVGGNSEIRIETKMKRLVYKKYISITNVEALDTVTVADDGTLTIGGAATLGLLESTLKAAVANLSPDVTKNCQAILRMLPWFASPQIRNVATVSGGIITASPIADLNPILMATNATLKLEASGKPSKSFPIRDFFQSYRKTYIEPDQVVAAIIVPGTTQKDFVSSYKMARRREDDISIACAAFRATVDQGKIIEFDAGFGGMGPVVSAATEATKHLKGVAVPKSEDEVISTAEAAMSAVFRLHKDVPGGMPVFRRTLATAFVTKFLADMAGFKEMASSYLDGHKPETTGAQAFVIDSMSGDLHMTNQTGGLHRISSEKNRGIIGEPIVHQSALLQATGEARYTDDIPAPQGTLHLALVLSQCPLGKLVSIDATEALQMPGVVAFYSAKDISPEANKLGAVLLDEELFRSKDVTAVGQTLGVIIAESHDEALAASHRVKVQYDKEGYEPVITIRQSVAAGKEHSVSHQICDGDVEAGFAQSDVIVEGEIRMGGQEHFYLETNATLVVPTESGELELFTSSQSTKMCQKFAAKACGLPNNRVVCRMKRMGGGFGGKETRVAFISSVVAFAAHKLQRACRINVERQQDMVITGTRHPFIGRYKVGATKEGKLIAADIDVYNNAGWSLDLSEPVMDRSLFHIANAYKIPNLIARGHVCYTNTVTNTAFRGFGGPQGMMICENYLEHVAKAVGKPVEEVRALNLMPEAGRTHYGELVRNNNLRRLWDEIHSAARGDIAARRVAIEEFNKTHRFKKRGLAVLPTMFGINFTALFYNQAGALVHIYTDGSVLISHGGTEMGQGLNTKCLQVAARAFNIPIERVFISECSSDKVPNASPTAASVGSDIYGMAVLDACEQISKRLEPYWKKICPDGSRDPSLFPKVVDAAYFDRCNLSAQGFYITPGGGYDWNMKLPKGACNSARGEPFNYYTQGVACSEVEIDTLTGDMRTLRSDIVMDVGKSLNPAIDIGQIEGAFAQGMGWCTLEECVWGGDETKWLPAGQCFTTGPGNYKLPSANDIPVDFRVTLLADAPNPKAIHSSKAVGEPPLFMAASVFFAAKEAIGAARADHGLTGHFSVDSPLTSERIRLSCGDPTVTKYIAENVAHGGSHRPALFC